MVGHIMKQKIIKTLCLAYCCIPAIGMAEAKHDLSFTTYLATDYMFRGVSQTGNKAALQFGLDYSHISGLQAGLFASNVDYDSSTNREQDIYIGYSKDFSNGIGIDAYAWYYGYHNESELNYSEYTIGARYKWFNAKYWYADDYSGTGGKQKYYEAGLSLPINNDFTFSIHAGHTDFDRQTGINDYNDYSLSLSTSYKGFDLQLFATSTDDGQFGNLEDDRFVFTISKSFGLVP